MFEEKENPGYEQLSRDAAALIARWCQNDWYNSSSDAGKEEEIADEAHTEPART